MRYVSIELNGRYRESGPEKRKTFRFDRFYEQVERILAKRSVRRVLVHRREAWQVPLFGVAEEVAGALGRLVQSGREVWYYSASWEAVDCVCGAACTHRVAHPLGTVSFPGVAVPGIFFRELLDTNKIGVDVIRRGRYKSAADPFRTDQFDDSTREQYQSIADGVVCCSSASVAGLIPEDSLTAMLSGEIFTTPDAASRGIITETCTVDSLLGRWKEEKHREKKIGKLRGRFGRGRQVAVLCFEGAITDGESRRNSPAGPLVGDRTMVKEIRDLRKNRRVKAVVFRINSGGGSATASESILRELAALNEKKPVVISMGPVAGSGGYWVSATGRRVYANATTLTGSIGVLTVFFNLAELLRTHGITVDTIRQGPSADLGTALRPLTEEERRRIDGIVGFLYGQFLRTVADARNMTPEAVDALGQGRVWLGAEAVEKGLVDHVGGLHEAIRYAASLLGVSRVQVVFKPRVRRSLLMRALEPVGSISATTPMAVARHCIQIHGKPLLVDPVLARIAAHGRQTPK